MGSLWISLMFVSFLLLSAAFAETKDSKESGESSDRDRRGSYQRQTPSSYGHPSGRISTGFSNFVLPTPQRSFSVAPPLSPASRLAPFSVFASTGPTPQARTRFSTAVIPAKLAFQKTVTENDIHSQGKRPPPSVFGDERQYSDPSSRRTSSRPAHPFSAIGQQSLGFTPAQNRVPHQPFILSPHAAGAPQRAYPSVGGGFCSSTDPCSPIVTCAPFFEQLQNRNLGCSLYDQVPGACCSAFGAPKTFIGERNIFGPLNIRVPIRSFSLNEINIAAEYAIQSLKERDAFELELRRRNVVVTDRSRPAYGHLQFFKTTFRAVAITRDSLIHQFTGASLQKRFNLSPIEAGFGLMEFSGRNTIIENTCPEPPRCGKKEYFYRTIDGSCNNNYNTKWGQARTPFQRIIPPRYSDGHSSPRRSVTGRELPSPRIVSTSNVPDVDRPDLEHTLSVMQWGQFIDHDLTHTPIFRFDNDTGIECCDSDGKFIDRANLHPSCLPIHIPRDDPFYSQFNRDCMNFVRSMTAPRDNCTFGFTEQMNQVTHFLDGSAVYGSSPEEQRETRAHEGGLLKVQKKGLLPADRSAKEADCNLVGTGLHCFLAGDNRVNEQPDLSVIHTLWVRQHNLLARELAKLNPHWNDETIYQETRRIVAAQIQHIVYNEWLPLIIGTNDAANDDLLPLREGFYGGYDPYLNPRILNEFATVAFRFGHTLVQGMFRLYNKKHQFAGTVDLHDNFNSPHLLYEYGKFDELVRGLFKQPMQSFDNAVTDSLTNRLFKTAEKQFGMDLVALNTQRGRDHGIPSYNELREACGLPRAQTFYDLTDYLKPDTVTTFKHIYASVDDIDPFVAGISESPVNGGIVGPLFNCIMRDQFKRLKLGDRFYYENGGLKSSFTEAQLHEIRKTSWARIICDNSDHIHAVQPLAFRTIGHMNEKTSCDSPAIPKIDLTPWISAPPYNQ